MLSFMIKAYNAMLFNLKAWWSYLIRKFQHDFKDNQVNQLNQAASVQQVFKYY